MPTASVDGLIVMSSDERYFPLAKGLVLSLIDLKVPDQGFSLGFVDIGCARASVDWLQANGVIVRAADESIMGSLADPGLGYHRSQTCRPFLPELFPFANIYIWLDSDTWVQSPDAMLTLRAAASAHPERIVVCPECHYSYLPINNRSSYRRGELHSYYLNCYGSQVANSMAERVMLNSGVFAASAQCPLWNAWALELRRLYAGPNAQHAEKTLHFAEQIALNVLLTDSKAATLMDPLFNYLCLWVPPHVDAQGVVRVSLPPYHEVSIVHLAGGWRRFGKHYFDRGLLYRQGAYMTADEKQALRSLEERATSVACR